MATGAFTAPYSRFIVGVDKIMDSSKKFDYNVVKHYATLSRSGSVSKEFNLVSYNGNKPKYDLRSWKTEADGSRKPYKGLTLTDEELNILISVFCSGEIPQDEPEEIRNESVNSFQFPYQVFDEEQDEDEIEITAEDPEDLIDD